MILDSRDGEIMRTRSCENKDVNDVWLCDKGWFGYEFINHPDRLQTPLIRRNGKLEPATWDEALNLIANKMKEAIPSGKIAAFGGNPLTVEENFLFQKLIREGTSSNHIDHRIGVPEFSIEEEGLPPGMEISIGECEKLSYAILLGLDLTEEFPVLWLRLKQAINQGAKIIYIGHYSPEIAKHLSETVLHAPGQELDALQQQLPKLSELFQSNKMGAIFVGSQYLSTPNRSRILSELLNLQKNSKLLSLNVMEGNGNSLGARFAGMRPDLGPLSKKIDHPGLSAHKVLENTSTSGWDFLYVAGANPAAKYASELWKNARNKLKFLVVQDLFLNETAEDADVVLPTLCYVEKEGSFITIAGCIQKLNPGKEIPDGLYSDGEIFTLLAHKLNISLWLDPEFTEQLRASHITLSRPQHINVSTTSQSKENSGSLYASFATALFDRGVRMQHNAHVSQLAKGPSARIHPSEAEKRNIHENDEISLHCEANTFHAKIKLDKGVAKNTVVMEVGTQLYNGLPVLIGNKHD